MKIQYEVMNQLMCEPMLNATEIGVAVQNGIVTLSGQVDNSLKKIAAERAAMNVDGVKGVAQDIRIGPLPDFQKTDTEIALAVITALKWNALVPADNIKVKVEEGDLILEGNVNWDYQRTAAQNAVEHLAGVKTVYNFINVFYSENRCLNGKGDRKSGALI